MKIVIIGDGKVGYKLAKQLSSEKYDIILIDNNEEKLRKSIGKNGCFLCCGRRRQCGGSAEGGCTACRFGDCLHFYGRVQYAQLSDREKAGRTGIRLPG